MEKPVTSRVAECVNIVKQLQDLGIYEACREALQEPMRHFVHDARSASGQVYVPELSRTLKFQFSNRGPTFAVLKS